jgi:hypothetical protein
VVIDRIEALRMNRIDFIIYQGQSPASCNLFLVQCIANKKRLGY